MGDQIRSLVFDFTFWKAYRAVGFLNNRLFGPAWHEKQVPINNVISQSETEIQTFKPQPADGLGNELPSEAIQRLEEADIAIRFGFGILKGDALTAPDHGVVSYHHGDLREYRGQPAGFHEYMNGEEKVGVTVQRLNEKLDAGEIAAMTHVPITDASSWPDVTSCLFAVSPDLLPTAVKKCIKEEELQEPDPPGTLYTTPTNRETLSYFKHRMFNVVG